MDRDFLLETYGRCYDAEAGPWNLSLQNKYLEFAITRFFEENFPIPRGAALCNIGIGAGYWDRYLSYRLDGGTLTSIDIQEICCRQLEECLVNERNPNPVQVICSDVMLLSDLADSFDIVTMVGSARLESGLREDILDKAVSFLKSGGSLYYQTLDSEETEGWVRDFCQTRPVSAEAYLLDTAYGFKAQYWKLTKGELALENKDFWENCWQSENPEAMYAYLDGYYRWKDGIIDVFRAHRAERVCDAACGFGAYSLAFASNGFQVESFDISPSAAEITRRGLARYGIDARVKTASILETGYEDEAFDGVIASSVLDHMTSADARKALAELYRITRNGGLVLVSFDTAEDSDFGMAHEVLPDGSLRYAEGTPRVGMIFHPYDEDGIASLLEGKTVLYAQTNQKGEQVRILQKRSADENL